MVLGRHIELAFKLLLHLSVKGFLKVINLNYSCLSYSIYIG